MAVQVVQAVQAVHLESDAFLVCLNHALSTEKEEVMGLCIGELNDDTRSDSKFAYTGTEMRTVAEKSLFRKTLGRSQNPLEKGVHAKNVEEQIAKLSEYVRTQAMYQMMDQGFVGLIFSCFIEDKNTKTGRVLYTCFQSIQAQKSSESLHGPRDFWSSSKHISIEGQKEEERYERIEIPIHIVPHVTIGKVCLESAVELPKILCQEEQDAYRRIHSLTHLDSVTKIHNGSVFTKNLCSQMSAVSGPLLQWLEDRLEQNQQHLQELQQEKEELMQELSSLE
uniref:BRCA1/BRCA2-containing complex, subunit 3 isoform 1 (Predicted) n=1 Tax=Plecturocebus moloch TaxID=9523 RepID=B1MTT8_PLEMO|nr:BRCA1/BRCA2-containing complex, subunit 3 isoform 1 (predicted) [Plecturocebus moloch]